MKLLGPDVIVGALVAPANAPEKDALEPLVRDAKRHAVVTEYLLDRGYLASSAIAKLRAAATISCKPAKAVLAFVGA